MLSVKSHVTLKKERKKMFTKKFVALCLCPFDTQVLNTEVIKFATKCVRAVFIKKRSLISSTIFPFLKIPHVYNSIALGTSKSCKSNFSFKRCSSNLT